MNKSGFSEMSLIGTFRNYLIVVYTNDSNQIPHFHIMNSSNEFENFESCMKLEKPEYSFHTGRNDILNEESIKELIAFFQSKDKWGEQNWIVLLKAWVRNNPNSPIDINTPIPDYVSIFKY